MGSCFFRKSLLLKANVCNVQVANLCVRFLRGKSQKGVSSSEICCDICNPHEFLSLPALFFVSSCIMMARHRYTYILWHKDVPPSSKSGKLKIRTYLISRYIYPCIPQVSMKYQRSSLVTFIGTGRTGQRALLGVRWGEWYSILELQKGFTLLKL